MNKEDITTLMDQLFENYDFVFTNLDLNKKTYIGKREKRVCRFCGKDETETNFNNVAHAIPECLGNKYLICADECDSCNEKFSHTIEDHFDKKTLPLRTINMIKGKKKVPSFKTQDHKARIDVKDREKRFMHISAMEDSDFYTVDKENNTVRAEYILPPHIPASAYKALVKMALSIMPNKELDKYKSTNTWIQEKEHREKHIHDLKILYTFIPGINPFKQVAVFLLKRKNDKTQYPECMFVLAFGGVMYQIMLPSDNELEERIESKTILKLLSPFEEKWPLGKTTHKILDWSETKVVKGHKEFMQFSYDELKEIDPRLVDLG